MGGVPAPVPAVQRAVAVLDLLARQPDLTMSGIWTSTGLPKSSVYNLMAALEQTGLVERNQLTGTYRLGLRLLNLAGALQSSLDVRQAALPELRQLTEETRETTHLGVLEARDLEVIYIEKMDSPLAIKLGSYVGRKVPTYCTGLGKMLLSGVPDAQIRARLGQAPLVRFTPNTQTDLDQLLAELAAVRRQGYALDNEEHEAGVRCVAAPVYGRNGEMVAAVSIAGPASRMTRGRQAELVPRLLKAVAVISRRMGYQSVPRL